MRKYLWVPKALAVAMMVAMMLCVAFVSSVLCQSKCPVQIRASATAFDCDSATALQNLNNKIAADAAAACAKRKCNQGTCYLNHVIYDAGQPVYSTKKNKKCPDGLMKYFSATFTIDCQCR